LCTSARYLAISFSSSESMLWSSIEASLALKASIASTW
jgi:hypothetical protein